jgi:hypothetical protein
MKATDIAAMLDLLAAPLVPLFRWLALFRLVSASQFGHNPPDLKRWLVAEWGAAQRRRADGARPSVSPLSKISGPPFT